MDQKPLSPSQQKLNDLWEEHLRHEFTTKDTGATLDTMGDDACVNHVPVLTGGNGKAELRAFYAGHFIPHMPPDFEIVPIARTIGDDRLVDELVARFTHTVPMDWILPGVAPTGRRIVLPIAVSVEFRDGLLCSERIYWDQASVLVQAGLIERANLPVLGAEVGDKILDPSRPMNGLIERARR